jgi:hypothetical protein
MEFYDFPYIGNNDPNWRTPSFFRGVASSTTNQTCSSVNIEVHFHWGHGASWLRPWHFPVFEDANFGNPIIQSSQKKLGPWHTPFPDFEASDSSRSGPRGRGAFGRLWYLSGDHRQANDQKIWNVQAGPAMSQLVTGKSGNKHKYCNLQKDRTVKSH